MCNDTIHRGSCLCGNIKFEVTGELNAIDACHCTECRKYSGHFFVSTDILRSNLKLNDESRIKWFSSSEKVQRGFCPDCGSSLFWSPTKLDWISVAMGAFDTTTTTQLQMHIHVSEKGDYYDISDNLPQKEH